jgi:hypothetical protein
MGDRVNQLKSAMLYAEVRAFELQEDKGEQSEEHVTFALHKVKKGRVEKRQEGGRDASHWDGFDAKKFCVYCKHQGHDVMEL